MTIYEVHAAYYQMLHVAQASMEPVSYEDKMFVLLLLLPLFTGAVLCSIGFLIHEFVKPLGFFFWRKYGIISTLLCFLMMFVAPIYGSLHSSDQTKTPPNSMQKQAIGNCNKS